MLLTYLIACILRGVAWVQLHLPALPRTLEAPPPVTSNYTAVNNITEAPVIRLSFNTVITTETPTAYINNGTANTTALVLYEAPSTTTHTPLLVSIYLLWLLITCASWCISRQPATDGCRDAPALEPTTITAPPTKRYSNAGTQCSPCSDCEALQLHVTAISDKLAAAQYESQALKEELAEARQKAETLSSKKHAQYVLNVELRLGASEKIRVKLAEDLAVLRERLAQAEKALALVEKIAKPCASIYKDADVQTEGKGSFGFRFQTGKTRRVAQPKSAKPKSVDTSREDTLTDTATSQPKPVDTTSKGTQTGDGDSTVSRARFEEEEAGRIKATEDCKAAQRELQALQEANRKREELEKRNLAEQEEQSEREKDEAGKREAKQQEDFKRAVQAEVNVRVAALKKVLNSESEADHQRRSEQLQRETDERVATLGLELRSKSDTDYRKQVAQHISRSDIKYKNRITQLRRDLKTKHNRQVALSKQQLIAKYDKKVAHISQNLDTQYNGRAAQLNRDFEQKKQQEFDQAVERELKTQTAEMREQHQIEIATMQNWLQNEPSKAVEERMPQGNTASDDSMHDAPPADVGFGVGENDESYSMPAMPPTTSCDGCGVELASGRSCVTWGCIGNPIQPGFDNISLPAGESSIDPSLDGTMGGGSFMGDNIHNAPPADVGFDIGENDESYSIPAMPATPAMTSCDTCDAKLASDGLCGTWGCIGNALQSSVDEVSLPGGESFIEPMGFHTAAGDSSLGVSMHDAPPANVQSGGGENDQRYSDPPKPCEFCGTITLPGSPICPNAECLLSSADVDESFIDISLGGMLGGASTATGFAGADGQTNSAGPSNDNTFEYTDEVDTTNNQPYYVSHAGPKYAGPSELDSFASVDMAQLGVPPGYGGLGLGAVPQRQPSIAGLNKSKGYSSGASAQLGATVPHGNDGSSNGGVAQEVSDNDADLSDEEWGKTLYQQDDVADNAAGSQNDGVDQHQRQKSSDFEARYASMNPTDQKLYDEGEIELPTPGSTDDGPIGRLPDGPPPVDVATRTGAHTRAAGGGNATAPPLPGLGVSTGWMPEIPKQRRILPLPRRRHQPIVDSSDVIDPDELE